MSCGSCVSQIVLSGQRDLARKTSVSVPSATAAVELSATGSLDQATALSRTASTNSTASSTTTSSSSSSPPAALLPKQYPEFKSFHPMCEPSRVSPLVRDIPRSAPRSRSQWFFLF